MLVLPVTPGLGSVPNLGQLVLGNLVAAFRQSATVLALVGCATVHRSVVTRAPIAPAPTYGQSAPSVPAKPELPPAVPEVAQTRPPEALPTTLPLEGFEPAILQLPSEHRPLALFVVSHGAGGQAKWHCRHYELMLGPYAGLVCLAGKRMAARNPTLGYYYPNHVELGNELRVARAVLLETHGPSVAGETAVYIGYSQGATMGALAVGEHGEYWPLMALVEGGFDSWSPALARKYKSGGGQRVLFVCGTEHCQKNALAAESTLVAAGLETKLLYARGAGHRPDGPVAGCVREGLRWLLERDGRYIGVLEHLKQLP